MKEGVSPWWFSAQVLGARKVRPSPHYHFPVEIEVDIVTKGSSRPASQHRRRQDVEGRVAAPGLQFLRAERGVWDGEGGC